MKTKTTNRSIMSGSVKM